MKFGLNKDRPWWKTRPARSNVLTNFRYNEEHIALIDHNLAIMSDIRTMMAEATAPDPVSWFRVVNRNADRGESRGGSRGGSRGDGGRGDSDQGKPDNPPSGKWKPRGRPDTQGGDKYPGLGSGKSREQGGNMEADSVQVIEGHSEQHNLSSWNDDESFDQGSIDSIDPESMYKLHFPCLSNAPSCYHDEEEASQADDDLLFDKYRREDVEPMVNSWISSMQEAKAEGTQIQTQESKREVQTQVSTRKKTLHAALFQIKPRLWR